MRTEYLRLLMLSYGLIFMETLKIRWWSKKVRYAYTIRPEEAIAANVEANRCFFSAGHPPTVRPASLRYAVRGVAASAVCKMPAFGVQQRARRQVKRVTHMRASDYCLRHVSPSAHVTPPCRARRVAAPSASFARRRYHTMTAISITPEPEMNIGTRISAHFSVPVEVALSREQMFCRARDYCDDGGELHEAGHVTRHHSPRAVAAARGVMTAPFFFFAILPTASSRPPRRCLSTRYAGRHRYRARA